MTNALEQQLEAVTDHLFGLADMNRMAHYKSASHVLEMVEDYQEQHAESDLAVLTAALKDGHSELARVVKTFALVTSTCLHDISTFIRGLQFDIDVIEDVKAKIHRENTYVAECEHCHKDICRDDDYRKRCTNPYDQWSPPEFAFAHEECAGKQVISYEVAVQRLHPSRLGALR